MNCKLKTVSLFWVLAIALVGCEPTPPKDIPEDSAPPLPHVDPDFEKELEESGNYLNGHDFDGDGAVDEIYFEYTGGAHCCYLPRVQLSSDGKLREYLLEMDGGYVFGMPDGSQPQQFEIGDFDEDGREEIFIEIFCYNGRCDPLPKEWVEAYGVKSNWILMEFEEEEWRLRDVESRR